MLLTVDHVTRYFYDQPVRGVVQSHRLMPSQCAGQKMLRWKVTVSDGQMGGGFRDGAGDWVQGWTVLGPVNEITVQVTGQVETVDQAGVLRGHKELTPAEAYLRKTHPTEADAALAALAEGLDPAKDALAAAHEISARVSDAILYTPDTTNAHTTAAEALAQGTGVCQDQAHAVIAIARHAGLPARYVSGYLLVGLDGAAHDAAHAWAEVFIAGLGWVGFDPANRCCPDDRYIRLGSGLDSRHAAMIRGIARGQGEESLVVSVSVQEGQIQSQTQQ
ncbi:transglutaminase family protein [Pseudotabrizicola algicola]|uniref:Transglutaminase family protein n=1 Tax=Pseudotabrizicola algicola TaxID=2709381 RepID=A0A6B3RQ80_9RHOB|nr:transglutaminase family protein [Pseudotabrizicola algicola]NEX47376.1 transglutaminase family protein [Pseudotabrizicola algicola]